MSCGGGSGGGGAKQTHAGRQLSSAVLSLHHGLSTQNYVLLGLSRWSPVYHNLPPHDFKRKVFPKPDLVIVKGVRPIELVDLFFNRIQTIALEI